MYFLKALAFTVSGNDSDLPICSVQLREESNEESNGNVLDKVQLSSSSDVERIFGPLGGICCVAHVPEIVSEVTLTSDEARRTRTFPS